MSHLMHEVVTLLESQGLPSRWYLIHDYDGYSPFTGEKTDIYCLEAWLGESQVEGYETYAVAQLFSTRYPSLATIFLIDRHRESGIVGLHKPIFNIKNDSNFSKIFLPVMFTAFNTLNPTEDKYGVLVQIYQTQMHWGDLIYATAYTLRLVLRFKRDGQLAIIAVDFDDPLIKFIARITDPIASLLIGDVHQVFRTAEPSLIRIAVEDGAGGYREFSDHSTALDKGLELAATYLEKQYNRRHKP